MREGAMSEKDILTEEKCAETVTEAAEDDTAEMTESAKATGETEKKADEAIAENIRKNLPVYYASVGVLVAMLALALVVFITVIAFPKNETVEAGDLPNYSYITQNRFWGDLCEVVTDVSAIDTTTVGVKTATLRFFGFIDVKSRINVIDTVPPVIALRDVVITSDVPLEAGMFVAEATDATEITYAVSGDGKESGEYKVSVCGTDGGGNAVTADAVLTVVDSDDRFTFERGVSADEITEVIRDHFGFDAEIDMSSVNGCGKFTVTAQTDESFYYIGVNIKDTAPPTATVRSYDLILGEKIGEADLIAEIADDSEVTAVFGALPDFGVAGEYAVEITLTDAENNTSEYVSYIRIHDINTDITADVLSTNDELAALIFNDEWSRDKLTFGSGTLSESLVIGENTVTLAGEYNTVEIKLNGIDTTPPALRLKDIYKTVGTEIYPEDFVLICTDASEVTYSFAQKPASGEEGRFMVTVAAVDNYGNETVAYANVHYYIDRTMPIIYGLSDITAVVGETPSYLKNVYATDDNSANVKLWVNTDEVDFASAGVYPITYIAVDESGNETRETVLLHLVERVYVSLDVENILQNPRLPNGCEVVSLAIALAYEGYETDPVWLFENYMPSAALNSNSDPWTTYIGDPRSYGLGCYAPCVVTTGNDYLADMESSLVVSDVSGLSLEDYEGYIDSGTPVIMWGLLNMNGSDHIHRAWYVDGERMIWHSNSHCLVLIGYTNYTYIFCDPLRGVVEYSREAVEKSFEINFRQACVIEEGKTQENQKIFMMLTEFP